MTTTKLATPQQVAQGLDRVSEHVKALSIIHDVEMSLNIITTHISKLQRLESGYGEAVDANQKLYGIKAYDHKTAAIQGIMIMFVSFITCLGMHTTPFVYGTSLICAFILGYMMNIWCTQRDFLRNKHRIQQSIINTYLYNIDKEKSFIDRETKAIQDTYPDLNGYFHNDFIVFAKEYLHNKKAADLTKTIEAYNARNAENSDSDNTEEPSNG